MKATLVALLVAFFGMATVVSANEGAADTQPQTTASKKKAKKPARAKKPAKTNAATNPDASGNPPEATGQETRPANPQ